ncbi:hypothetical protein Tco_1236797 [Tanacetum coccineum]
MIDSRLENIDHTQIIIPPLVPLEQLVNDFMNPPNVFEIDDLEYDDESIDTPLVSLFIDSDDELDDGEVLNELNEYGNVGNFYPNRRINCIGGCDLAFPLLKNEEIPKDSLEFSTWTIRVLRFSQLSTVLSLILRAKQEQTQAVELLETLLDENGNDLDSAIRSLPKMSLNMWRGIMG